MIKITDEMKERINKAFTDKKPCVWATASKDGVPSISFRGSTFVWDDEHLAIWERGHQSGEKHMQENPDVVMLYADLPARVGWRFYGKATIYKDGEMRQKIMDRTIKDELDRDPDRKGFGVLVRVEKIRRYSGDEILQQR